MNYAPIIPLLLLLPLLGFLLPALVGKKKANAWAGWVCTILTGSSLALSVLVAHHYFWLAEKLNDTYSTVLALQVPWLQLGGSLSIDIGILLDPASAMMLVVVPLVSAMVHLYSIHYMRGEERYATYFAYLGLFTFSMLGLVVASNLFQLYIFWELVGVSSYLLIGFYYHKPTAVSAAKKAFIITRFADAFFLAGILILGHSGGSFDILTLLEKLSMPASEAFGSLTAPAFLGVSALTWALVLIFIGGAGKSAMFPLHIWLPHAMEGPTPVSALIHAATMVVAGVFLVARLFPAFVLSPAAMHVVAYTGIFSALLAAIIACTQTDIKRILAFSTMSQIGYMMAGLGVSGWAGEAGMGYTGALFHLFTHAFFKSLLFLAAGMVIHAVHSNDLGKMGGLARVLPFTHLVFLIGCMAIAGLPLLAGFYSKEMLLLALWQQAPVLYGIALFTAWLTAFYMFRLYFGIFRGQPAAALHSTEAERSWLLKLPLLLLGLLSMGAGWLPFPKLLTTDGKAWAAEPHYFFALITTVVVLAGIAKAWYVYGTPTQRSAIWAQRLGPLYRGARQRFYMDELWQWCTQKLLYRGLGAPAAWTDRQVIDAGIEHSGQAVQQVGERIKGLQSGKVQHYLLVFFIGALVLGAFIIWWHQSL